MKNQQAQRSPLLTFRQAAERLNVCLNTTRKLADDGELLRVSVGKRGVRIPESSLEAYIERNTK